MLPLCLLFPSVPPSHQHRPISICHNLPQSSVLLFHLSLHYSSSIYLTHVIFPPLCHDHICLCTCWCSLYFVFSLLLWSLSQFLFLFLCFESDLYILKLFIFLKDVGFFLEFSFCFSSLQEPSSISFIELMHATWSMQNLSRTQTLRMPMEPKQTWRTSSYSWGSAYKSTPNIFGLYI